MLNLLVEFIGTFVIAFVVLATANPYAIGATLALSILFGGAISGGAFNPAVTVAMYSADQIAKKDLLPYILVQLLAGVVAYEAYKLFIVA